MAWDGVFSSATLVTNGAAVNDNAISAASSEFDNSSSLDTMGMFELKDVDFVSAPNDEEPTIDVYYSIALDGTNYTDPPLTGGANQDQYFLCSIPVRKTADAIRICSIMVPIPPGKLKFYFDNQTGQQLPANWDATLYTASIG